MKLFEEVAAAGRDLRQGRLRPDRDLRLPVRADDASWRSSAGSRSTRTATASGWPSTARCRAAAARAPPASLPGPPAEFVGYEQTEVLTAIVALNDLGDGTFEAKLERSPFYPAGGGQVTDQGWIEHDGDRRARGAARGRPVRRRPDARLRGRGLCRRRPRQGGRPLGGALPDDGEPHGDAPAARGAPARARRARPAGGLGRAPRQAALRLHARAGADAPRSAPRSRSSSTSRSSRGVRCGSSRRRSTRRGGSARRCSSARSTATSSASSRSTASRASSAAARTSARPPRSARS